MGNSVQRYSGTSRTPGSSGRKGTLILACTGMRVGGLENWDGMLC